MYLARGWLREPQRPLVHEGVLDGEVVGGVEDGDLLVSGGVGRISRGLLPFRQARGQGCVREVLLDVDVPLVNRRDL